MVLAVGDGPLHLLSGGPLAHLVGIRSMIVRRHVSKCEVPSCVKSVKMAKVAKLEQAFI